MRSQVAGSHWKWTAIRLEWTIDFNMGGFEVQNLRGHEGSKHHCHFTDRRKCSIAGDHLWRHPDPSTQHCTGWQSATDISSVPYLGLLWPWNGDKLKNSKKNHILHEMVLFLISYHHPKHTQKEVRHLRCACDCALNSIRFHWCNCMFYIPTSTASFPCQYGLGPRVNEAMQHSTQLILCSVMLRSRLLLVGVSICHCSECCWNYWFM